MSEASEGGGDSTPVSQNVAITEFGTFVKYITKVVTILLEEEDSVPPALEAAIDDRNNHECIRKFLSDPQVRALFIQRNSSKGRLMLLKSVEVEWWVYGFFY